MSKWKVKGCPRCGGDMFLDRDMDSWYEQCLQCSYKVEMKNLDRLKETVSAGGGRSEKPRKNRGWN